AGVSFPICARTRRAAANRSMPAALYDPGGRLFRVEGLAPADYALWLSGEPDPRELMRPFPCAPMRIWPISTRVNAPGNDDASIVDQSNWLKLTRKPMLPASSR